MAGENSKHKWPRLGKGDLPTEDADIGLGHIVSTDIYLGVLVTLLVLTVVTVAVAQFDFGSLNLLVAMGVATVKATLVTLFFMHLNWENKIVWGIVIYPLFVFLLILGGTLGDVSVRPNPQPTHGPHAVK